MASSNITDLLQAWERGDSSALEKLIPLVETELRRLAQGYMRKEKRGPILQTTALVNEAYIKLMGQERVHWQNRNHFYAIAAQCMRRVLLDYAKAHLRQKREGALHQVSLSENQLMSAAQSEELLILDAALKKLAEKDERKSQIVELRYFGGYTVEEVSTIMGISEATVARHWRMARAWLHRELTNG